MLERLTQNFRLFLKAFDGEVCPLCAARTSLESHRIGQARAKGLPNGALCARHLEACSTGSEGLAIRARRARKALESIIAGKPGCPVCDYLTRVETRLAKAIRHLDGRMRFHKALETAPLFCQRHTTLIASDFLPPQFLQIQSAKLRHLRDALAQAEILKRESFVRDRLYR